jgi:hypothetical protein
MQMMRLCALLFLFGGLVLLALGRYPLRENLPKTAAAGALLLAADLSYVCGSADQALQYRTVDELCEGET